MSLELTLSSIFNQIIGIYATNMEWLKKSGTVGNANTLYIITN